MTVGLFLLAEKEVVGAEDSRSVDRLLSHALHSCCYRCYSSEFAIKFETIGLRLSLTTYTGLLPLFLCCPSCNVAFLPGVVAFELLLTEPET